MPVSTFAVPVAQAERLRRLSKESGKPAGTILAELIDEACASAGLDVTSDAVSVHSFLDRYVAAFFGGTYVREMSAEAIRSLATDLTTIADRGGVCWNVDHEHDVHRQGSGVVLQMSVVKKIQGGMGGRNIILKKSMSPDAAREIAKGLLTGLANPKSL